MLLFQKWGHSTFFNATAKKAAQSGAGKGAGLLSRTANPRKSRMSPFFKAKTLSQG
jgi:hypothetical protein